jgi:integrase
MKKGDMRHLSRVVWRGPIAYFRAKIPPDLVGRFKQKHELTYSLRTRDRREAERVGRIESVKFDAECARLRRERETLRTEITDEELERLIAVKVTTRMAADEVLRVRGMSDAAFEAHQRRLEVAEAVARRALASGDFSGVAAEGTASIEELADNMLSSYGFKLPRESPRFREVAYSLCKASLESTRALKRRQLGDAVATPVAEPLPYGGLMADSRGDILDDLLTYWQEQAPRKPKTLYEFTTAVRRFNELHGALPAAKIEKRHVVGFKDKLIADGLAQGTVKKQIGALSAVLQLAHQNDKLPSNPARAVRLPRLKVEKKARLSFTNDDLRRIFAAPVFTAHERPKAGAGEAAYWLPLIALYNAARLTEIRQLRVQDIAREAGFYIFHITDEGEDAGVKTIIVANAGSHQSGVAETRLLGLR